MGCGKQDERRHTANDRLSRGLVAPVFMNGHESPRIKAGILVIHLWKENTSIVDNSSYFSVSSTLNVGFRLFVRRRVVWARDG
jgi:hypothetical protein